MAETMKKKRVRSGETQIDFLIDYMLKHKTFAVGRFLTALGRQNFNEQWNVLSGKLNDMGPSKTVEQWKKVWKNQKLLARKRASEIKIAKRKTGNFTPPPPLSEKEKKILSVIGVESSEGLGFREGSVAETVPSDSPEATEELELLVEPDIDIPNMPVEIEIMEEGCIEVGDHTYVGGESTKKRENEPIPSTSGIQRPKKKKSIQSANIQLDEYGDLIRGINEGLQKIAHALNRMADSMAIMGEALKQFFDRQT